MNLFDQLQYVKQIKKELEDVGIPVTGVYEPSNAADGGIEIDGKFVVQYAPYHEPRILLDRVESPGNEIASFETINGLIKYLMET